MCGSTGVFLPTYRLVRVEVMDSTPESVSPPAMGAAS